MKSRAVAAAIMAVWPAQAMAGCPEPQPELIMTSCDGPVRAELVLLAGEQGVPVEPAPETGRRLVITGTYTSGEEVEPEGFVLDHGEAYDPYVQGWDGLLLLTPDGALSVHHVERVPLEETVFDLRVRAERRSFVDRAEAMGLSAIQSHLIVVDGAVDVRVQPGAPRFRRRVLFTDAEGDFGIFDSSPRMLTLAEAAAEVAERFAPQMAFNLDMGSYDYCALASDGSEVTCGALQREQTAKLSNLLVFTQDTGTSGGG